jgi:hypothetical protein
MLCGIEDRGAAIPEPSGIKSIATENDDFVSLIEADTTAYRKFYVSRAMKKTLSIPVWLNNYAEKNNLNFSQVLQDALRTQLGL